jgi:hypothetical protein
VTDGQVGFELVFSANALVLGLTVTDVTDVWQTFISGLLAVTFVPVWWAGGA